MGAEHHAAQAITVLLQPLEAQLQTMPQLGGATPCAADIGMFPFVRQFAAVQPARIEALPLPAVKAWLAGWLAHPLFAKVMEKQAPVRAGRPNIQTASAA
jgi:glutathione S-transferase